MLAVADEVDQGLLGSRLLDLRPDLILSCGDLPIEYLENLGSRAGVPLAYVPGNHDPADRSDHWAQPGLKVQESRRPFGGENVDGRLLDVAGIRIAGLGGCLRYSRGANQYTQRQMRRRALRLELRQRLASLAGRPSIDILVAHAPAFRCGDLEDPAHQGFAAFHRLVQSLRPRFLLHGHVHPYGRPQAEARLARTVVLNVIPYRLIEL